MVLDRGLTSLFDTVPLGKLTLSNRIVMSPMTRGFAPGGVLDPLAISYYRRRAEGGAGLIITEGTAPNPIGAYASNIPSCFGDEALAAWKNVVDAVHDAGGRIMLQIWHSGLGRIRAAGHDPDRLSVGPCATYLTEPVVQNADAGFEGGHAMTQADIDVTIDNYAVAAANAKKVGFDGIELHAAHGYLIDQFFWGETNRRSDGYGGGIFERTRFCREIIAEIRNRVGSDYPIGLRFSQWKLPTIWDAQLAKNPFELEQFITPLADAGVTFFDCSTRRYWEPAFEGDPRNLAGWTRAITGLPTMTVGSVGLDGHFMGAEHIGDPASISNRSLDHLLGMIERGEVDLIGVGRAILANHDWANKMREGKVGDLRPYSGSILETLS